MNYRYIDGIVRSDEIKATHTDTDNKIFPLKSHQLNILDKRKVFLHSH